MIKEINIKIPLDKAIDTLILRQYTDVEGKHLETDENFTAMCQWGRVSEIMSRGTNR